MLVKDAIAGLRELLEEHPSLINSSLTAILHACARIISDEVICILSYTPRS